MRASDYLQTAKSILQERGNTYDSGAERSMSRTVSAFNSITGKQLTEAEGYLLLQLLKDVRQWSAGCSHMDSAIDCIGYAALKAEAILSEER